MSKAQMAFRLGYFPHCLRAWEDLYWERLSWEPAAGIGASVLLCLERMTEAVVALADEIPTHVFMELRECLRVHHERWGSIIDAVERASHSEAPVDFSTVR